MGFIAWIVLGLIAGAIARLILPGRQGSGWLGALITGILGALLGGGAGTIALGAAAGGERGDAEEQGAPHA